MQTLSSKFSHNFTVIHFLSKIHILIISFILNLCSFWNGFLDDANEYLDLWTEQFQHMNSFSWVVLKSFPNWNTIKNSMKIVAERASFDLAANSSKVLMQYDSIKKYCSEEKFQEWANKKATTEERWVEIFKHMSTHNVAFIEFSQIIEYVLCLPGSTGPVERIFANANKIWKVECSSLHVSTLKSILFVKYNIEYSCIEFFEFLKSQPQLLRKIASQDKYSFKQQQQPRATINSTSTSTASTANNSPGAMSVDSVQI